MAEARQAFQQLFGAHHEEKHDGEFRLRRFGDNVIPARLSLTSLSRDHSITGILVSDLTSEKSNAELASQIQSLQDEERKKISRELHDSVGQLLAAIGMNLSRLRNENLSRDSANVLSDCGVMVDQLSREIRTISHLLHPPLLDMAGLASAIRWYVDGFSHRSNIKVAMEIDSDLGRLPDEVESRFSEWCRSVSRMYTATQAAISGSAARSRSMPVRAARRLWWEFRFQISCSRPRFA